jgi:hypothetical protein
VSYTIHSKRLIRIFLQWLLMSVWCSNNIIAFFTAGFRKQSSILALAKFSIAITDFFAYRPSFELLSSSMSDSTWRALGPPTTPILLNCGPAAI